MSNSQKTKVRKIKSEDIIFESDNGTNTIIEEQSKYLLLHKNGNCACFDHDRYILKAIIKAIEKDGNFQISKSNKLGFYIADHRGKMEYGLNQLIICTAYHKKMNDIKKGLTKYVDGNMLNCCLDNLDCTKISNTISSTYTVAHDEKYIYLKHSCGQTAKLTYYPELYKIVRNLRWNYQKGTNAFYTVITRNHCKERIDLSLHQLAYIYYRYHEVTHRNILSNIRSYKTNFSEYNLEVDHLDSERMNDCEYNISAMDKSINISKSNITTKIVYPFFHYAVYVNDTYRVAVGMYVDSTELDGEDEVIIQACQCNTAELYVELLRRFYNEGLLPNGERLHMLPKKWYLETSEEKRQPIDQTLPKIDKEDIIDRLSISGDLPLYENIKNKGAA